MQTPLHTVGLVGKYDNQGMEASVRALGDFLRERGHAVLLATQTAEHLGVTDFPTRRLHDVATGSDVVVVLGGDGTMLSIARELAPHGVPLIGINQGRLGFLTDITVEDMYDAVAEILSGQYVARRRLWSFGLALSPWQTAPMESHDAVGRFEGDAFDPDTWKPRTPTAAYIEMRDDDAFWAARRVMAFSDQLIRAVVKSGEFADKEAERYLADVLIKRRDTIGRTYLTRLNPIVDPALDASGTLTFGNAAVDHRLADAPASYRATWSTFDNVTGQTRPLGETTSVRSPMQAPAGLPTATGSYIQVEIAADHAGFASWKQPVRAFFLRQAAGWKLVGLERMPEAR